MTPLFSTENEAKALLDIKVIFRPVNKNSSEDAGYILTFIDNYSRYDFVYYLKNKSSTFDIFKKFKAAVECQKGRKMKTLRSDRARKTKISAYGSIRKTEKII